MQRVMPTWGGALTWGALTCEGGGAWNRGGSCHAFQSARGWQLVHINILEHHLLLILLQEFLLLLVSRAPSNAIMECQYLGKIHKTCRNHDLISNQSDLFILFSR